MVQPSKYRRENLAGAAQSLFPFPRNLLSKSLPPTEAEQKLDPEVRP